MVVLIIWAPAPRRASSPSVDGRSPATTAVVGAGAPKSGLINSRD
jgi:hypothetical protein